MASLKLYKTTSRFKRQFKRNVYYTLLLLRDPVQAITYTSELRAQLIKNTLRQRSGHYMKKSIRACYAQIPGELKQRGPK